MRDIRLPVSVILAAGVTLAAWGQVSGDPCETARRQFQAIVSRLDVGGDFLFVGNCDGLIQDVFRGILGEGAAKPPDTPEGREALAAAARVETFLRRNGLYAVQGIGVSAAPLPDGRHTVKAFIGRDYVESGLPFWRGLFGWHSRRLSSLDFIPGDAAMARASTSDPAALWSFILAAMGEAAAPERAAAFAAWRKSCDEMLGVPMDRIVESLRDEVMVAVRFRADRVLTLPTAAGSVAIPAPEVLFGVSVKSDILRGVVEAQLARRGMAMTDVAVGESSMRHVTAPLPLLTPVQPAMATESGFFLIGSTTNIVSDALLAYRHKTGLTTRPEFIRGLGSLPLVNNGLIHVGPAMSDVASRLRRVRVADWAPPGHPLLRRVLQSLAEVGEGRAHTAVILNWKSGVMVVANGTWGGKDILRQLAARPVRILGELTLTDALQAVMLPFSASGVAAPASDDGAGAGGH